MLFIVDSLLEENVDGVFKQTLNVMETQLVEFKKNAKTHERWLKNHEKWVKKFYSEGTDHTECEHKWKYYSVDKEGKKYTRMIDKEFNVVELKYVEDILMILNNTMKNASGEVCDEHLGIYYDDSGYPHIRMEYCE